MMQTIYLASLEKPHKTAAKMKKKYQNTKSTNIHTYYMLQCRHLEWNTTLKVYKHELERPCV